MMIGVLVMDKNIFKNMEQAIQLIEKSNNIFIISHINPDGDNLGSSLALALSLKKINKNVMVVKNDIVPKSFTFLPGIDLIKEYNNDSDSVDLLIVLDCSDENRLGENKKLLEISKKVINIDHHISNTNFGDINIVDAKAGATGELIYHFIQEMNITLDEEMSSNIYVAISTDTGSFRYENATPETHRIAANLLETGIDKVHINSNLYENMSFTRMKLFIKSLATLETFSNGKIAVIKVTQDMLKETGSTLEDTEGIISFIRKLSAVESVCLLKELGEKDIKISLRTKNLLDASLICGKFDGGGHKRAAGCTIYNDMEEAKKLIVNSIQEATGI